MTEIAITVIGSANRTVNFVAFSRKRSMEILGVLRFIHKMMVTFSLAMSTESVLSDREI